MMATAAIIQRNAHHVGTPEISGTPQSCGKPGGEGSVTTVFSMMNMCGNIGAAVFPLVVPTLVGTPVGWDLVLFVFAGVYVAAGACWMLVNPNSSIVGKSQISRTKPQTVSNAQ